MKFELDELLDQVLSSPSRSRAENWKISTLIFLKFTKIVGVSRDFDETFTEIRVSQIELIVWKLSCEIQDKFYLKSIFLISIIFSLLSAPSPRSTPRLSINLINHWFTSKSKKILDGAQRRIMNEMEMRCEGSFRMTSNHVEAYPRVFKCFHG